MLKVFAIAAVLLFLELAGLKFLMAHTTNELLRILIIIVVWTMASITAWYPFAIGICGGPDSFYKN